MCIADSYPHCEDLSTVATTPVYEHAIRMIVGLVRKSAGNHVDYGT